MPAWRSRSFLSTPGYAAEVVLSGAIKSAAGEKIGGVTVSAKAEGGTITTTVFTDEAGEYYFPPLEAGKYQVWAQAISFATAKSDVDLARRSASRISRCAPITDFETASAPVARRSHPRGPAAKTRRTTSA